MLVFSDMGIPSRAVCFGMVGMVGIFVTCLGDCDIRDFQPFIRTDGCVGGVGFQTGFCQTGGERRGDGGTRGRGDGVVFRRKRGCALQTGWIGMGVFSDIWFELFNHDGTKGTKLGQDLLRRHRGRGEEKASQFSQVVTGFARDLKS